MSGDELGYIPNSLNQLEACGLEAEPEASIIFRTDNEDRPYIAAAKKGDIEVAIKALAKGKERMSDLLAEYSVLRALNLKVLNNKEFLPSCQGWYADQVQMGLIFSPLGTPLIKISKATGVEKLVRYSSNINSALVAAHSDLGFVHRDVSPYNIIIHQDKAILIDWAFAVPIGSLGGKTGTNAFFSVAVSRMRKEDKHAYAKRDDFESLFFRSSSF